MHRFVAQSVFCSLLLGWWVSWLAPARAAGDLYAFVDGQGVLHITDRLGDVPEPYQAMYRHEAAEQQRRRQQQQQAAPATPPPAPAPAAPAELDAQRLAAPAQTAASQAEQRGRWKAEADAWRSRLKSSTEQLQQAEQRLMSTGNPVLRETPGGRQRWLEAQGEVRVARERALEARRMLLEVLPKRAKEEHVPPQWLLP